MLILFGILLFCFGALLFCVGITVWVIGISIRLYKSMQRRPEPQVITHDGGDR
jgi:hypothetical protein